MKETDIVSEFPLPSLLSPSQRNLRSSPAIYLLQEVQLVIINSHFSLFLALPTQVTPLKTKLATVETGASTPQKRRGVLPQASMQQPRPPLRGVGIKRRMPTEITPEKISIAGVRSRSTNDLACPLVLVCSNSAWLLRTFHLSMHKHRPLRLLAIKV